MSVLRFSISTTERLKEEKKKKVAILCIRLWRREFDDYESVTGG